MFQRLQSVSRKNFHTLCVVTISIVWLQTTICCFISYFVLFCVQSGAQSCGKRHWNRDRKQIPNDVDTFIEILDQILQFFLSLFYVPSTKRAQGQLVSRDYMDNKLLRKHNWGYKNSGLFFFPPPGDSTKHFDDEEGQGMRRSVSSRVYFGRLWKQSGKTVENDKKTSNTARPAISFRWELLKRWSMHARPVVGGVNGISKRQNRTATNSAHLHQTHSSAERWVMPVVKGGYDFTTFSGFPRCQFAVRSRKRWSAFSEDSKMPRKVFHWLWKLALICHLHPTPPYSYNRCSSFVPAGAEAEAPRSFIWCKKCALSALPVPPPPPHSLNTLGAAAYLPPR